MSPNVRTMVEFTQNISHERQDFSVMNKDEKLGLKESNPHNTSESRVEYI